MRRGALHRLESCLHPAAKARHPGRVPSGWPINLIEAHRGVNRAAASARAPPAARVMFVVDPKFHEA
jgi:hypothetical protein